MKKLLIVTILLSSLSFAQNGDHSLLELKQQLNVEVDYSSQKLTTDFSGEKKNRGTAILYSLLLPGMGELYADGYDSGVYFTIADVAIWGTLIGMNVYGNWQEDNYKSFALANAAIAEEGKNSTFYADISSYNSVEEFNNEKLLNRNFDELYNTDTHYWQWADNNQRKEYRDMWSSSEQAFTNVRFAAGALLLNRIISMINAVRLVNKYNNKLEESLPKVSVGVNYAPDNSPYLTLNLKQIF